MPIQALGQPTTNRSHVQGLDEIRVLLADDHAVVRAGLKAVLGTAKDIVVIGEARNGREAVDAAVRLNPHVVVMDLSMDVLDGVAATRELRTPSGRPIKMMSEGSFIAGLV